MNVIESTLIAILSSAICTRKLTNPVRLTARQWKKLFESAQQQQVAAIVYDELNSSANNIPDDIKSLWERYSIFSARRFDAQLMALTQLSAILDAEKIRMMVLKGVGLALNYPKPELRECGDIDIFCFGDYDKVNEFVVSSGLDKNARETEEKHFGFEINGIEVENHRKFCSGVNHANSYVDSILMNMSTIEPYIDSRLPQISLPSPQMGALHLTMHTLSHLAWSGITLRHLCDLTLYLRKHKSDIDFEKLKNILREARIEKSAALLFDACNRHFGLDMDLSVWQQYRSDATNTLMHSIFHPFKNSCFTSDHVKKLYRKAVMHRFRASQYRLVYGEKYPKSFLESFVCLKKKDYRRPLE